MNLATKAWDSTFPDLPTETAYFGFVYVPKVHRIYAFGWEIGPTTAHLTRPIHAFDFDETNRWRTLSVHNRLPNGASSSHYGHTTLADGYYVYAIGQRYRWDGKFQAWTQMIYMDTRTESWTHTAMAQGSKIFTE